MRRTTHFYRFSALLAGGLLLYGILSIDEVGPPHGESPEGGGPSAERGSAASALLEELAAPAHLETTFGHFRLRESRLLEDGPDAVLHALAHNNASGDVFIEARLDGKGHWEAEVVAVAGEFIVVNGDDSSMVREALWTVAGSAIETVRSNRIATLYRLKASDLATSSRIQRDLVGRFGATRIEANGLALPTGIPNDPGYAASWALAKLEMEAVWETYGFAPDEGLGRRPVIAVVDNGAPESRDFHMWVNEDEIPGNGIDDDGNGFIDDVNGFNFRQRSGDLSFVGGHGSAVARIAAAQTDNGYGTASPASHASLMRCIYYENVNGSHFNGLDGILYAIENGADVVNCSFVTRSRIGYNLVFEAANQANVVIVAAAGPGRRDLATTSAYPAGLDEPRVLSVGASDINDQLGNSNFGPEKVDLFAPGESTSFSTPLASSTIALLKSIRPEATPEELISAVIAGVDRVPALEDLCVSGGRLNARGAVAALLEIVDREEELSVPPPEAPELFLEGSAFGSLAIGWTGNPDNGGYELQIRAPGGEWEPMISFASEESGTRLGGLANGALYGIRLRSLQGDLVSEWTELEIETPGPLHSWTFTGAEVGHVPDAGYGQMPLELPPFLVVPDNLPEEGLRFTEAPAGAGLILPLSAGMNESLLTSYTLALWVRPDPETFDGTAVLFEQGDFWRGLNLILHRGFLHANAWNRPATESDWSGTALWGGRLLPGEWNHLVLVLDARESDEEAVESGLFLYLNGEQVASGPAEPVYPHRGGNGLGGVAGSTVFLDREVRDLDLFQGTIRELSVWEDALTKAEVEALLVDRVE